MAVVDTNIDSVIDAIGKGIEVELKKRIKAKLLEGMDKMVDDIADEYSKDLRGAIEHYRGADWARGFGEINILIKINDKLERK